MPPSVERERLMVIACYALWQLRDLDPAGEPAQFRQTRIEIRRHLDRVSPPEDAPHPAPRSRRHLRLVGAS